MTDFKHIEEQIATLRELYNDANFQYEKKLSKERVELKRAADTMQSMLDVMRAAQRASYQHGHHEIGTCMCPDCDLYLALDKLKDGDATTV